MSRGGRARRALLVAAWLAFLAVGLEAGSRAFWSLREGVPFLHAERIRDVFQPELRQVMERRERDGEEGYHVLLLGGSVLHRDYGTVRVELEEALTRRLAAPVRVYACAGPGRTSLDSLRAYRLLSGFSFDVVFLYHGINEVRANNCPREVFRDDYTHYAYYDVLQRLDRAAAPSLVSFPFTAAFVWTRLCQKLGGSAYVPPGRPREEWIALGGDLKTPEPFRGNVEAVADLARARGEPLVLATFAIHLPPDYTRERFARRELDYCTHLLEVELWGRPENVRAGVEAHDRVLREVAAERGLPLVDLARLLPRDGVHFNDVCHLTARGGEAFAGEVAPVLERVLRGASAEGGGEGG